MTPMPEARLRGDRSGPRKARAGASSARGRSLLARTQRAMRSLAAAALLCASGWAIACPLCMGAFQQSKAEELVTAPHAVLAVPTADPSRFRVIEVLKGERPAGGAVEGDYPHNALAFGAAGARSGKPLLLVRDDLFSIWTILGPISADHLSWLRKLASGKHSEEMNPEDWRARVALVLPYIEHREPLVAELAYGTLAAAPYAALLTAKPRLAAPAVRRLLADPGIGSRESTYLLLLGIAGNAEDAAAIERRLEAASAAGETANLGPLIAADLQLRGPARMAWVDERYLRDPSRKTREIEAALLALSAQGNANSAIPRERVIQSYRMFIREHRDIAGYVAQDLAAWRYWDAVPEYVALMKSSVRQQYPSRLAIVAYLRQSPGGGQGLALPEIAGVDAARSPLLSTPK